MNESSTAKSMIVYAYGVFLDKEKDLEFSTRNTYKRQAAEYLQNPDDNSKPNHFDEAIEMLEDFTS